MNPEIQTKDMNNMQNPSGMTPEEKAEKAKEILISNPSPEDREIAIGLVKEAAADNSLMAIFILAQMYYHGTDVEKDDKKAFELCQQIVASGYERGKLLLAQLYVEGVAVEKDLHKAKMCLNDLMEKDDAEALYDMGCFVLNGTFPDIDEYAGIEYLQKAISLGHKLAMARLGQAYASLCETEKADYWFAKAEAEGVDGIDEVRERFDDDDYDQRLLRAVQFYFARGKYDDGFRLINRDVAAGNRTARYMLAGYSVQGVGDKNYGRDIQRALDIYGQLSAEGESFADYMLGCMFCDIDEVKDVDKGVVYWRKAAEAGYPDAQYKLAYHCCEAQDDDESKAEGKKWMEAAAEQGQDDALYLLASCLMKDNEVGASDWEYDPGYEQDTQKGLEYMKRAAEEGNYAALACLAQCYQKGKYVEKDDNQAFAHMWRSCNVNAQSDNMETLADYFRDGIGTPQDYEKAAQLYQKAIDLGSVSSLGQLSFLYRAGNGVEKDEEKADELWHRYVEAVSWLMFGKFPLQQALALVNAKEDEANEYLKDSRFTLADVMDQLGDRYAGGDEVEQDESKAVEWWEKAAQRGCSKALCDLGVYYSQNDDIPKALEYMERSAAAGYPTAQFNIGSHYVQNGKDDAEKDKGMEYVTKAAESGNTKALHWLVCVYHDGEFVDKDYDKARYWLSKFLATDDPIAHWLMANELYQGDMYEHDVAKALEHVTIAVKKGHNDAKELYLRMRWHGDQCEQNREEVISTFEELAEGGDSQAMFQLYLLYTDETFDGRNEDVAKNWLQKAAEQGNADAFCELAYGYAKGDGVEQDVEKALSLFDQAIERGSLIAVHDKAIIYLTGANGVQEPDCDKAIELLRPYTENDAMACYLMANACNIKCSGKNAYSWELASEATQYMEKAAEGGMEEAMKLTGQWYGEGKGVMQDFDKVRQWLRKYAENTDESEAVEDALNLPDEEFEGQVSKMKLYYWQDIVEANKERIADWQEYVDDENNIDCDLLAVNATQLGELNAAILLGGIGLNRLKTAPDEAKRFIKLSTEQGLAYSAELAGKALLNEDNGGEKALREAIEYFNMGAEQGHVGCILQLGLLYTTEGLSKETEQVGDEYLRFVCDAEGDDWEEERQQAKARLEELKQRHKSLMDKFISRMRKK